jgi:hypothetical protein
LTRRRRRNYCVADLQRAGWENLVPGPVYIYRTDRSSLIRSEYGTVNRFLSNTVHVPTSILKLPTNLTSIVQWQNHWRHTFWVACLLI